MSFLRTSVRRELLWRLSACLRHTLNGAAPNRVCCSHEPQANNGSAQRESARSATTTIEAAVSHARIVGLARELRRPQGSDQHNERPGIRLCIDAIVPRREA